MNLKQFWVIRTRTGAPILSLTELEEVETFLPTLSRAGGETVVLEWCIGSFQVSEKERPWLSPLQPSFLLNDGHDISRWWHGESLMINLQLCFLCFRRMVNSISMFFCRQGQPSTMVMQPVWCQKVGPRTKQISIPGVCVPNINISLIFKISNFECYSTIHLYVKYLCNRKKVKKCQISSFWFGTLYFWAGQGVGRWGIEPI